MKIFTGKQIQEWDRYTMQHEPIRPIDLMERAARALSANIMERWGKETPFIVFAGPGNNGGDALAVARLMTEAGYSVEVFLFNVTGKLRDECSANLKRLTEKPKPKRLMVVTTDFDPPHVSNETVIIDGLFGSGINKPLSGGFAALVKFINTSNAKSIVSIDLPSGLMTEDNTTNIRQNIVRADLTLTLHRKKLSMYFADNAHYLGEIKVLDIGLSEEYEERSIASYHLQELDDIKKLLLPRHPFSHKGQMGHSLLFAGSYGMAGAAALAAKACLRSGSGKVTIHTPHRNNDILQTLVPEAILQHDKDDQYFCETVSTNDYDAVAIGPGIGQDENTAIALMTQIRRTECPIVLDADALNILASHRTWMQQLPKGLILTPHPAEADRLLGIPSDGCYDRLAKMQEMAERLQAYIILKGHYTALCTPDREVFINSSGNAGMATAGAGDVLTGIITALLARGYNTLDACRVGIYLHGLAGDIAAAALGEESMIASDIINHLPLAFKKLSEQKKQNTI